MYIKIVTVIEMSTMDFVLTQGTIFTKYASSHDLFESSWKYIIDTAPSRSDNLWYLQGVGMGWELVLVFPIDDSNFYRTILPIVAIM